MNSVATTRSTPRILRISPASLGFVLSQCEACFVREVRDGIKRPGGPPEIFNLADRAMKEAFASKQLVDLGIGPKFTVLGQGLSVESAPIKFPELGVAIVLAGRLDAFVLTAADERVVVDYKTTANGLSPETYRAQLSAYAFALENPGKRSQLPPTMVDGLALLVYRPTSFAYRPYGLCGLYGRTQWVELPRRDDKLHDTLQQVAALVTGARPPEVGKDCRYCAYRIGEAPRAK